VISKNFLESIPGYVKNAMQMIADAGGTPYIVGGAVRDLLMGREPHDYDIACDLIPDDILHVLISNHVKIIGMVGFNFGVVVCLFEGHQLEIATFRGLPIEDDISLLWERCNFSKNIEDDLSRRDFTINAMALDSEGNLLDPYHGREDLKANLLRPVGNSSMRYDEDAVRMFRACRLASELGFTYTENENGNPGNVFVRKNFWEECEPRHFGRERVRKEMERLLLGDYPEKGLSLLMTSGLVNCPVATRKRDEVTFETPLKPLAHLEGLNQSPAYHEDDVWEHTLQTVRYAPRDLKLRWAMLFHDVGKGLDGVRKLNPKTGQPTDYGHDIESARMVAGTLASFAYHDHFIREVCWLVRNHMAMPFVLEADKRQLVRWLRKKVPDFRNQNNMLAAFTALECVFLADLAASRHSPDELERIQENILFVKDYIKKQMPVHSSDLAVSGKEILELLADTGLKIEDAFNYLLRQVQSGRILNEEDILRECICKWIERGKMKNGKK